MRAERIGVVRAGRWAVALALLAGLGGCGAARAPRAVPAEIPYLSRAEWEANPPVARMQRHRVRGIVVHHTATLRNPDRSLASKMQGLQRFSQQESPLAGGGTKPAWPDVPYHFYIDHAGRVAEGRSARFAGDSNTPYDPRGHLQVVLEGNFELEEPTEAQWRTLEALLPALARRWRIARDGLSAHRDHAETLCPGENLYRRMPRLRALVADAPR